MNIFETTLRDGEQAAGIHLSPYHKASIAGELEDMGCDFIDAGFPAASRTDWEGSRAAADATRTSRISVLARQLERDMDRAAEAMEAHRDRSRLATWVMPYELYARHRGHPHIRRRVLDLTRRTVRAARNRFPDVQYYLVYSANRDPAFLADLATEAAKAGAGCISVADSQGGLTTEACAALVRTIRTALPVGVDVAIHAHNTMGLALANTIAAILAGATQVETAIGGMGDAGGHVALEQILAYAHTFQAQNPLFATRGQLARLYPLAARVATMSGFQFASNQPLVGIHTFTVESGVSQSLMHKIPDPVFAPETIGRTACRTLGRHSGVAGLQDKLRELAIPHPGTTIQELYVRMMETADYTDDVPDDILRRIATQANAIPTLWM